MTDPEITELGMARVAVSGLIDENKMLRADNERLRAALTEIAAHDDQFSTPQQARAMRDAARRALEPKP